MGDEPLPHSMYPTSQAVRHPPEGTPMSHPIRTIRSWWHRHVTAPIETVYSHLDEHASR